jgi:Ca2+-binding RTX toxin-like protein
MAASPSGIETGFQANSIKGRHTMTARFGVFETRTRFLLGFVAIGALAMLIAFPGEPAFAKRIVGTKGADRIVGTAKPDRINARKGNDRVNGSRGDDRIRGSRGKDGIRGAKGSDWLSAGPGADRLNAVDGHKDRVVNGGSGRDVCTIDRADRAVLMSCEKTRVTNPGGGGPNPGGGGATKCVAAQEAKQKASGESRAAARVQFSQAFYATTITLEGSADGLDGQGNLPITIDQVCLPKSLAREALQIAGGSGVVNISPSTKVFQAGRLLQGPAATTAVAGADSVTVRARLKRGNWGRDEDGTPIPTFAASRITVTD